MTLDWSDGQQQDSKRPAGSEPEWEQEIEKADLRIREGRFQRWLALAAGLSSLLSGLEVSYEHYKGSYSRPIMYTPVILSGGLTVAGIAAFFSRGAAKTLLPLVSGLTLADSVIGFYFHVQGIRRKPGGWRLPVVNIVMGPPIFAPLLFGTSAYLGLVATFLRRGDDLGDVIPRPGAKTHWAASLSGAHETIDAEQDLREGRFQQHMIVATIVASLLSGFEAAYSHYKNNFRYGVQWTPLVVAPMLMAAGAVSLKSRRTAHTWLPAVSAVAMLNGGIGFGYHLRGVLRRPGGGKKLLYNIIYGPPVFAPLLFAASGFLGVLASLLGREEKSSQPSRTDDDPRPIDPRTGTPLTPSAQPGYYPGYHTLDQCKFWDAKTREVVLDRVHNVPKFRFFNEHNAALLTAICERVLPQADRDDEHKISIAPQIDKRLYEGKHDGYRYEKMPPDPEAFTMALRAIEDMARAHYGRGFLELRMGEQDELLRSLHDGKPIAAHDVWDRMPSHRFWLLLVQDCAEAFYAHPWAWDEIGFGGPAYPRAYMRLERGEPEPWEKEEQRYEWAAPAASQSDRYEDVGSRSQHYATPGQGGTH